MAPYHHIRGTQPQLSDSDEEYDEVSTKLLDAEPWDEFSHPVSRRLTARSLRWPPISIILNIVLLGSLITFGILVNHFMQIRPKPDPMHNEIIRRTSEYCESKSLWVTYNPANCQQRQSLMKSIYPFYKSQEMALLLEKKIPILSIVRKPVQKSMQPGCASQTSIQYQSVLAPSRS